MIFDKIVKIGIFALKFRTFLDIQGDTCKNKKW